MIEKKNFKENDPVWIRRLDNSGSEYRGWVVGVSSRGVIDIYIVELFHKIPGYEWSFCTIPETCLDLIVT